MLSKINAQCAAVLGVTTAAVVGLALTAIGCGTDEGYGEEHVQVRTTPRSYTTTTQTNVAQTLPVTEPETTLVTEPEPPREVTYDEAEAAFMEKRYDDAVELFTSYTERKSENPWGFYMLGLSSWKAGHLEDAEVAFGRSLELAPRHVKTWINLGRVYMEQERRDDALDAANEALAVDSESGAAYRLKGRAFHFMGQDGQAIDAYRRALLIDELDTWSMNNLALIYIESERFDEALQPLARAVELESDNPVFLNNLGMALERTGRFRAAESSYREAVGLDPSYETATSNLSRIEVVKESPDVDPVDLTALAERFVGQVAEWRSEVVYDGPEAETE